MAKSLSSAIGVDIGRYSLKSVLLQKKSGNRYVLTHFASMPANDSADRTVESVAGQLKALMKQMGGSAKGCGVVVSSSDALVRIIEQPETPPEVLRDALRLNGATLLNHDCRNFVLDCVECGKSGSSDSKPANGAQGAGGTRRYLVAGLPSLEVAQLSQLFESSGVNNVSALQLAPVALFNAFEFAHKDVFDNQAFFLVDFGHLSSTMIIGARGRLSLIRSADFGGKSLLDSLCTLSGETPETALAALEQEDEVMVEYARMALASVAREIGSSIGFYEGQHEEAISQIWVSGGLARNGTFLRLLGDELRLPCHRWVAVDRCEVNVAASKRTLLAEEILDYSIACGAAAQLLNA